MSGPSHLDTIGPDHHAEMEAHYAAGQQRQDEQHLFDIAFAEAKARVDAEIEREGFPPSAQILVAWGVGAGVRAATSRLMREIGDAREELSRLKIDASNHAYRAESARRDRDKAEVEIGQLQFRLEAENARLRDELAIAQGVNKAMAERIDGHSIRGRSPA